MKTVLAAAAVLSVTAFVPLRSDCGAQEHAKVARTPVVKRDPQSAFNIFTVDQDIELGKSFLSSTEKRLPLLKNATVDKYLDSLTKRLASSLTGTKYPYTAKAVNSAEVNAFSLPGGPIYVSRGMLITTESEGDLASVLAHAIAHIALRHGTSNASAAYLARTGVGVLGGFAPATAASAQQIMGDIGGVGLNPVFLHYTVDQEQEADALAAQLMGRAGYDPAARASFLAGLRDAAKVKDTMRVSLYLADHRGPANREVTIRQLAKTVPRAKPADGNAFAPVRKILDDPKLPQEQPTPWPVTPIPPSKTAALPAKAAPEEKPPLPKPVVAAPPSGRYLEFKHATKYFEMNYPDNWKVTASSNSLAATFAPEGGIVILPNGAQSIAYGAIVNHYAPFEGILGRRDASQAHNYAPYDATPKWENGLEDATDDLVRQIVRMNPYLRGSRSSATPITIDESKGYTVSLTGMSPLTGAEERIVVYTRMHPDSHVIYLLCVAPTKQYATLQPACERMVRTLDVNEDVVHGTATMSASAK